MLHDDPYELPTLPHDGPTLGFIGLLAFIVTVVATIGVWALWGQP